MISFLSSWAKGLGLTIVIISILEMLLPNNKTKKYIRMVMGVYVIFTIISPAIENKKCFNLDNIDFEDTNTVETATVANQTSMDKRIEELYREELKKDIIKKLEQMGFNVSYCKVYANISEKENANNINKIKLVIEKKDIVEEQENENKYNNENNIENKVIVQVQKIKPIDTSTNNEKIDIKEKNDTKSKVLNADIQNIKKFLIEEYGVTEKCLEIN